ncbi:peptidase [Actinoplanes sp. SE50]|uniref:M1 family metallopeptidase n=1 Tax=unclassified Actinoplanes TaxID=2626549 RepID=UPI00023EC0FB|nr:MULTISPECIES: M1 family metallopeptidase [unclassified Actinoplanes]AEV85178.1 Glutamyl aminopeptidase [Actinoplanes sp. SE50/110]ATO83573.1 peptidase [Actinoplanes sp. SE50]SLM00980.1 metallopeptidase [Actinoplanes sp. SE50/110]
MRRLLVATLATALTLAATGAAAQAHPRVAAPAPGAPGIGDPYYPDYGNGGYDVSHYDIRLRYTPATDKLTGTTTILATATQDLSRLNLDFVLDVSTVLVNNRPATFAREGDHELVVTPARTVAKGGALTIVVTYSGVPSTKVAGGFTAWTRTPDGALAVGEPEIAWWWYPSNDHPADKATFDVSVSVPDGVEAISNGVQPRPPVRETLGYTRWSWRSLKPQATYLTFLTIGQYDVTTDTTADGSVVYNAYSQLLSPDFRDAAQASVERTAEITDWESTVFGPFPFEARGGIVVPPNTINFALENQTRPNYSAGFFRRGSNTYVIAHENAHQWFGDSVSVRTWQNIWLNEGFASYAEWLWSEKNNEGTAQEIFDYLYATSPDDAPVWTTAPADPGTAELFGDAVYDRGAMTLHQLRLAVGDDAFFQILRTWTATHRYGNGTTPEFTALAEKISGKDLDALFQAWLYTPAKPVVATAARSLSAPVAPKSWAAIKQTHALLHEH